MPQPTYTPQSNSVVSRFGGRPRPATAQTQPFINFNDRVTWSMSGVSFDQGNRQLGAAQQTLRAKGVWMSDDFGPRLVRVSLRYYEAAGVPVGQALAALAQAGEQYLTFDNATYFKVKFKGVSHRSLIRQVYPYVWYLTLDFLAVEPWPKDFQLAGSLANLLNPYGGFEGPAVQPTLYGSTIVQSNDFETGGATTDLFHSIGTEALGTLAAWTTRGGSPSIASNVISAAAAYALNAGHADWGDAVPTVRFQWATGQVGYLYLHFVDANNWVRLGADGTNIILAKNVAGTVTTVNTTAAALTNGTWYWLRITAAGTSYTGQVFNDTAGAIGAQLATTGAQTISNAAVTNGVISLEGSGANIKFGGAFANVCYVTGPCPTGWAANPWEGWGGAKEPAFCWSSKQAYYGVNSLSIYAPIAGGHPDWLGPTVSLVGGQTYQLSCRIKIVGGAGGFGAYLDLSGGGFSSNVVTASDWNTPATSAATPGATGNKQLAPILNGPGTGTVYFDYATIVQPTVPTGVLFNSLGAALGGFTPTGTLNAWTNPNGATITGGVVTFPGAGSIFAGHADWWDVYVLARWPTFQGTTTREQLLLRYQDANNYLAAFDDGTSIGFQAVVAGASTYYTASSPTGRPIGSAFWMLASIVGTTATLKLYKDAGGYPGDQLGSTYTATIAQAIPATGQVGAQTNVSTNTLGGNYPGTFLVQGPLPTGISVSWLAGEPAFCWSKNGPKSGTFAGSIYIPAGQTTWAGFWGGPNVTLAGGTTAYFNSGIKGVGLTGVGAWLEIGVASGDTQSPVVTGSPGWAVSTASKVLAGGDTFVQPQWRQQGPGTAYFDEGVVQGTFDAATGLYASAFTDQVGLGGSTGAGTLTNFNLTYAGAVFAEPVFTIKIPVSNTAPISQIKLQNTLTGEILTVTFSTPLAAGQAWTITIDCGAFTVQDQVPKQYDPVGSFPMLYGPPGTVNTFAATVVTSSGVSSGITLDTSWTNRGEL